MESNYPHKSNKIRPLSNFVWREFLNGASLRSGLRQRDGHGGTCPLYLPSVERATASGTGNFPERKRVFERFYMQKPDTPKFCECFSPSAAKMLTADAPRRKRPSQCASRTGNKHAVHHRPAGHYSFTKFSHTTSLSYRCSLCVETRQETDGEKVMHRDPFSALSLSVSFSA